MKLPGNKSKVGVGFWDAYSVAGFTIVNFPYRKTELRCDYYLNPCYYDLHNWHDIHYWIDYSTCYCQPIVGAVYL